LSVAERGNEERTLTAEAAARGRASFWPAHALSALAGVAAAAPVLRVNRALRRSDLAALRPTRSRPRTRRPAGGVAEGASFPGPSARCCRRARWRAAAFGSGPSAVAAVAGAPFWARLGVLQAGPRFAPGPAPPLRSGPADADRLI